MSDEKFILEYEKLLDKRKGMCFCEFIYWRNGIFNILKHIKLY